MILTRHLTPTLTVVALATIGPHLNHQPTPPPYPPAPNLPIDGHYHPCTHPTGVNVVCSIQYGDQP